MHGSISRKKQLGADALLLLTAFFWGITFAVVKEAIEVVPVFVFLAQRFGLAFIVMAAVAMGKRPVPASADLLRGLVLGGLLFGAYAFQTLGLAMTSASNAGFVTGMNVVLVPLFGAIFFNDTAKPNALWGVGFAATGLFLLCTDGTWALNNGDLLVSICAACVAFHIICTGRFARGHDVYWLTATQLGTVCALSGLAASVQGHSVLVWEPDIAWALILCALFASVFAFWAQTSMQRFTTSTRAALIFCMEPVFGAIYANWALGEVLGMWGALGAALIFAGMLLSELPANGRLLARFTSPAREKAGVD